jgi:hypothetical protein
MNLKKCSNCKHFISTLYKGEYTIGNYYGKCVKFAKKDPITDEFDYIQAGEARMNELFCGNSGKFFEKCNKNENSLVQDCEP